MQFIGSLFRSMINIDEEKGELDALSGRLKYLLDLRKMKQIDLANAIGIPAQTIQAICSGKIKKSKYAIEIAAILEVNPVWLSTGKGQMTEVNSVDSGSLVEVPILDIESLNKYLSDSNIECEQYLKLPIDFSNSNSNLFALKISSNELDFGFLDGTLLIFSMLSKYIKNGHYIFKHKGRFIIDNLEYKDGCFVYKNNVQSFQVGNSDIIAVLLEARLNYS